MRKPPNTIDLVTAAVFQAVFASLATAAYRIATILDALIHEDHT